MSALISILGTIDKCWDHTLPVNVASLCNDANVGLFFYPSLIMSGLFTYKDNKPVIYLNKNKSIAKLRYITVFELGRYLLGFKPRAMEPYDCDVTRFMDDTSELLKRFTTEVLLPRKAINFYMHKGNKSLIELSNLFGVTETTMAIRLQQLNIIRVH